MNKRVLRDYLGAKLVSNNCILDYYNKLYYQANENLVDIYLDMDFEDKDVLSVVSSGDQIYTPKLLGAKHVDGFDKNRLTKYYYYIRKWAITYNNDIYPYELVDGNISYLENLLQRVKVNSKEEKNALDFWNRVLESKFDIGNIFYDDKVNDGLTLFDDNIRYIKDVCLDDLNYSNIDFFNDVSIDRKYDFIIMSNIIEYCRGNIEKFNVVKNNLYKLLNDNGKVICSRLIYKNVDINEQEIITFDDKFDLDDYGRNEGYVYVKR